MRWGDMLLLNNSAIHCGGENSVLEEWLWNSHGIYLHFFLPPRSPELNPIKLLLNTVTQRMKNLSVYDEYGYRSRHFVRALETVLDDFTHHDVYSSYYRTGYVN
jgi:transposase